MLPSGCLRFGKLGSALRWRSSRASQLLKALHARDERAASRVCPMLVWVSNGGAGLSGDLEYTDRRREQQVSAGTAS